ncbi:NADH-quinone oxidoreductase subunit B [Motilibacter sp. E257]|uniref:NADH-quinone oxidoreductase subunit B n=1 Tax=Motilibacter deserti TaxID=2714956 RepID=A0ABX0H0Z4_9ACTN|nr:NADH-quinone oxidoreductase subunit B [Motilibacter deserti]
MHPGERTPLPWGSRHLLHVADAGLACCAVEVAAAVARTEPFPSTSPQPSSGGPAADAGPVHVLLVSGTVTDTLLPAVLEAYAALPEPRRVVAYGACVTSGGPYWDSYSVTKGIDQFLPVDVWVPGCPPRPEALADGLARLEALLPEDAA